MVPCTPYGCLLLLQDRLGDLSGLDAVVIGRSILVGKPLAALLLGANCTVTMAHSRTRDLADRVRRADIVVAAVGRPALGRAWCRERGRQTVLIPVVAASFKHKHNTKKI